MKHFIIYFFIFMHSLVANSMTHRLMERMKCQNSLVCVGLDPDLSKLPNEILSLDGSDEEKVLCFLKEVIDLTHEHACCYKAQKAFFDLFEGGYKLLGDTVAYIKHIEPTIPVVIDCKIGDTENTMRAYAQLFFEKHQVDAIVVNPYMGDAVFEIFQEKPEYTAIVLVQTSNPTAKIVQEQRLEDGSLLWEKMLALVLTRWNRNQNLIPVISSNSPHADYSGLRASIPSEMPILLAGVGAQGGDLTILSLLLNEKRSGVFVGSSRGILYPYAPEDASWREAIVRETIALQEKINEIRFN